MTKALAIESLRKSLNIEVVKYLIENYTQPTALLSLKTVQNQYLKLQQALPQVQLHYALKPLPLTQVVDAIDRLEGFFDLARQGELDLVQKLRIPGNRCIHTHPYKTTEDVKKAIKADVTTFVVDSFYEFDKLKQFKNQIQVLVRIAFPNSIARCDLSSKFGIAQDEVFDLIQYGHNLGFQIVGLSFHVGSQMPTNSKYLEAIRFCKNVFEKTRQKLDLELKILDIGGGFPVQNSPEVTDIFSLCQPISQLLQELFPNTKILAEPGRFIVANSIISMTSVIGKTRRKGKLCYYLDDGVYGTFSGQIFDQTDYVFVSQHELLHKQTQFQESILFGPTCDSIDKLGHTHFLPELNIGDVLFVPNTGAYSLATATDFNFVVKAQVINMDELVLNIELLKTREYVKL